MAPGDTTEDASDDEGQRPSEAGSMYAECEHANQCGELDYCVFPPGEAGYCSDRCDVPEIDCDPSPGGTAAVVCIDVGHPSARLCALDCRGDVVCPVGMRCDRVETNEGEKEICF
jgi:hypothetical protein